MTFWLKGLTGLVTGGGCISFCLRRCNIFHKSVNFPVAVMDLGDMVHDSLKHRHKPHVLHCIASG